MTDTDTDTDTNTKTGAGEEHTPPPAASTAYTHTGDSYTYVYAGHARRIIAEHDLAISIDPGVHDRDVVRVSVEAVAHLTSPEQRA